jgi:prepilin-type processing-associated H-X9-DG protein
LYANAHNGQFPDRLEDLLSNEIDLTPDVFVCPSSKDTPATAATTRQSATRLSSEPGHLSYIYLGKGLTDKAEATVLVAYEPMNHHGDGCNMLFADGHVEYVPSAQAKAIINQATSRPTTAATRP